MSCHGVGPVHATASHYCLVIIVYLTENWAASNILSIMHESDNTNSNFQPTNLFMETQSLYIQMIMLLLFCLSGFFCLFLSLVVTDFTRHVYSAENTLSMKCHYLIKLHVKGWGGGGGTQTHIFHIRSLMSIIYSRLQAWNTNITDHLKCLFSRKSGSSQISLSHQITHGIRGYWHSDCHRYRIFWNTERTLSLCHALTHRNTTGKNEFEFELLCLMMPGLSKNIYWIEFIEYYSHFHCVFCHWKCLQNPLWR